MPVTKFAVKEKYRYMNGFNCYHESVSRPMRFPFFFFFFFLNYAGT